MIHYGEIHEELQLAEDECCIIFDFGCYFPYANTKDLTFAFHLGEEELAPYKLNHRYPNRNYQTISKKCGRRVSKLGYPHIMKLDEQGPMILSIDIGIQDEYMTLVFPIDTHMTKECPVCVLTLRYNFTNRQFYFISKERTSPTSSVWHYWYGYTPKQELENEHAIILSPPSRIDDSTILLYQDVIEPVPIPFLNE